MPVTLDKLDRTIMGSVTKSAMAIFNELENWSACAGIKDDPDNAMKALANHYGHFGWKGTWVPSRVYITNATTSEGHHKGFLSPTLQLQRVLMDALQDSVKRKQTYKDIGYSYDKESKGTNKAFGTTNSPRRIVEQVARQMFLNQMAAMASVTPKNTKATLARKKSRSTQPLVDFGQMRAATHPFVMYEDEEV